MEDSDITVGTGCDLEKGLVYIQFSKSIKTLVLNREDTLAFIKSIRTQLQAVRRATKQRTNELIQGRRQ